MLNPADPQESGAADRAAPAVRPPSLPAAMAAGIAVVALAFAATELLAALGIWAGVLSPSAAPLRSLGNGFIVLTPEWLKEFAIQRFGTNDKLALTFGMYGTILVVAAALGALAARRLRVAVAVFAVLLVVTAVAILTRVGTSVLDLLPLLIGAAAALWFGHRLFEPAARPPAAAGTSRRTFLVTAAIGAVGAAALGGLSRLVPTGATALARRAGLTLRRAVPPYAPPVDADLGIPGVTPLITPNSTFYRIDTAFQPPVIDVDSWQLSISGLVDSPNTLSYNDIVSRDVVEVPITLTCVSNEVGGDLVGNAVWTGTPIKDLLLAAGPQPGADCVLCTDVDGFTLSAPLEALTDGRDALIAYGMNGEILPIEHGYPVRMVVPGLYGFVSATKWLTRMEVTRYSDVSAYWTQRGWSDHGPIKMSSRIDTPASFAQLPMGEVTVGGMAWAQHTGIARVDVQVDDGPWQPATLSKPLSKDTWVQWKFGWETGSAGLHTLRVRATGADGSTQIEERAEPIPNGSSGWHSRQVTVTG